MIAWITLVWWVFWFGPIRVDVAGTGRPSAEVIDLAAERRRRRALSPFAGERLSGET